MTERFLNTREWHVELRNARKRRKMSQTKLSELSGIHQPRISQIEKNLVDPRLSEVLALSNAVGLEQITVSLQELPIVLEAMSDFSATREDSPSAVEFVLKDQRELDG